MDVKLLDRLPDIALFLTVAEADSLSAAARTSGITVAKLSRRLAALEQALGVRLIDRTPRRFALTAEGNAYLDKLRGPMSELSDAIAALDDADREPHGTLRISASADFGATFLSPLIAEFAQLYPKLGFDIDLTPRQVDLAAERFDAAIRIGPLDDSALTSRRFATVPAYLYASPAYLAQFGRPEHPHDLERHACLPLPHMRGRVRLEREGVILDIPMSGRVQVNNLVMLRRLCGDGLGIAVLNPLTAAEGGAHCPVERVLEGWHLEPAIFYFLTPWRLLPTRTRAFFDFARSRLQAQGY